MSKLKWTPAPWCVDVMNNVWHTDDTKICDLSDHPDQAAQYRVQTMTERKGNAHLIGAAPTMYAALAEAALQLEYLHEKFTETGSGNAVLARIRDVMAKARGEGAAS